MKSFFQQILIDMLFISSQISLHLSCLLPAVPLSILFTPLHIRLTLKRLLSLECCLELLLLSLLLVRRLLHLRNCRIDPCGESFTTLFMFRVSVSFCNSWQYPSEELISLYGTFRLRADALDLGCLVLDSSFC